MSDSTKPNPWTILGWILNAMAAIALTVAGAVASQVRDMDNRIVRIEASRFTAEHGREVWKEIAAIKEDVARLPLSLPPVWFVSRVDRLDEAIKANAELFNRRLDAVQVELREMRTRSD